MMKKIMKMVMKVSLCHFSLQLYLLHLIFSFGYMITLLV